METNIGNLTTTQLKSGVPDYKVSPKTIDEAGAGEETYWYNSNWTTYLGYLKTIPEYRNAVRALSIYTCGRGWTAPDKEVQAMLENIRGWGEDTFDSIMQDMIIVKKTNGDAYCEIMRNPDNPSTIINLKKLNPGRVRQVVNENGILIGYDWMSTDGKSAMKRIEVKDMFHICNDRIANEIHGTSVLEACKWVIDWLNEMLSDLRRVMHRSTIRVLYIDADNTTKLQTVREQYKEAVKNGEVLILPARKGEAEFEELNIPPTEAWLAAIRFARDYFYEVLGVPKVITGGTQESTEASSKIGYQTFEQPYITEQRLLEQDIWNQLAIRIKFDRPKSLLDELQGEQQANQSQVGFQPSEMMPGRNE